MTVPRLIEISEYWTRVPPLHEAFASFFGMMKAPARSMEGAEGTTGTADDLLKDLFAAGISIPDGILDSTSSSSSISSTSDE